MPSRASSVPKAAAKSRGAGSAAAAGSSGGVIDGTDNDDMSPAQQWAMLTEDCDALLHAYIEDDDEGGIHQLVPEVFHTEVDEKRIEGNWGEHANLQRWANDILNTDEGVTPINAVHVVYIINKTAWPTIMGILPAGLQVLTRETFIAWCDALKNFCDGNVAEAETTLRNAGLINMPALRIVSRDHDLWASCQMSLT